MILAPSVLGSGKKNARKCELARKSLCKDAELPLAGGALASRDQWLTGQSGMPCTDAQNQWQEAFHSSCSADVEEARVAEMYCSCILRLDKDFGGNLSTLDSKN